MRWTIIVTLLSILACTATAQIVTNGGFETGDFTGWTLSSGANYTAVDGGSYSGIMPYAGSYEAALGTPNTVCYLSQTLSTPANADYLLSFWLNSSGSNLPNRLFVLWNGVVIFGQTDIDTTTWTNVQMLVTATGTNTILEFGFLTDYESSIISLDDVSVCEVPSVSFTATPKYGSAPLLVQFTSTNVDTGGNGITNWNWNFGDGSTSTAQSPSHTYYTEGYFSPSLIATNTQGNPVFGVGPPVTASPPNDNFTNAITLMNAGIGLNVGATIESSEPGPGGGIGSVTNTMTNGVVSVVSVTNTVQNTVWWSWTAPANGPASVMTYGSSFDAIIDVYTNNTLSSLVCVVSNLNTVLDDDLSSYSNKEVGVFNPANAGILGRVGFLANAGTTYQIQVSGLSEGAIDIAVQPIALKIVSKNLLSTNGADGSVNFNATIEIGNSGNSVSPPLELELLTHAGCSFDSNFQPGEPPPPDVFPADEVLTNYYLQSPSLLMPGANTSITISNVCPGPSYMANDGDTNWGFGWGVYAVLNAQFGTNWYFLDNDLLFYGQWPVIAGTVGQSGGVIRLDPSQSITANDPGYLTVQLGPPSALFDGAGWKLTNSATYVTASNYVQAITSTNAIVIQFKPISGWNLPANQTITVVPGQIASPTAFYSVTNPIIVARPGAGLAITGTTGTTYRIDYRTNTVTGAWLPLKTNTLSAGYNYFMPWPLTNGSVNFYRAVWTGD